MKTMKTLDEVRKIYNDEIQKTFTELSTLNNTIACRFNVCSPEEQMQLLKKRDTLQGRYVALNWAKDQLSYLLPIRE